MEAKKIDIPNDETLDVDFEEVEGKAKRINKRNDMIKIIAMVTMLIDHIGALLFPQLRILRTIGRIAFPIFAYQVAVGFRKTSNRKRYAFRLFVFAIISQGPYMFLNKDMMPQYLHFNVIFLLLYAIGMLQVYELLVKNIVKKTIKNFIAAFGLLIALIAIIVLPDALEIIIEDFAFSYSTYGLIMILVFYVFYKNYIAVFISYIVMTFGCTYMTGVKYLYKSTGLTYFESVKNYKLVWRNITTYRDGLKTLEGYFFQARSIMALPFIFIFERFNLPIRLNKYIAYIFYPIHITILLLIRWLIGGPIL